MATLTLAIDCGGTGIKGSVLDPWGQMVAEQIRVRTPYPLAPERLMGIFDDLAAKLPRADRATVGMPGMIRHGRVVSTPHYVTKRGPHTRIDPALVEAWRNYDAQQAVAERLDMPAIVLNDAEVAGAGAVTGFGFEVVFTLGTGLGCAIFDDGHLLPHLEVSRAPVRRGRIYDTYIGDAARKRLGHLAWSRRVRECLIGLRPMFEWDRLYLGGGNGSKVEQRDLLIVGGSILVVPNSAGIVGGVKAWDLQVGQLRQPMSSSGRPNTPPEPVVRKRRPASRPGKKAAPKKAAAKPAAKKAVAKKTPTKKAAGGRKATR
ncbi:MAG: ROK family protein [Candidatus Nanopelagicales bacterium]